MEGAIFTVAKAPGSIVNIDGVVNSNALRALKNGGLGAYLDSDSVSYILDFAGDFGAFGDENLGGAGANAARPDSYDRDFSLES